MALNPDTFELRVLESAEEIKPVEQFQALIWPGSDLEIVPLHILITAAQNGGLLIGAYDQDQLVGFVFGFAGFYYHENQGHVKHCSHMLGVHPDYRDLGLGFRLKRAQWQLVRKQGLDLITWTYDPLESRNAYLNISKLGAICNTFKRDLYGEMQDDLNAGILSDRFQVDWWVESRRVLKRLGQKSQDRIGLADYLAADVPIINETKLNNAGLLSPQPNNIDFLEDRESHPNLVLFEIPGNFQMIKAADLALAQEWRQYSGDSFQMLFQQGYMITDFVFTFDDSPRGYYVLTYGEATIGP